MLFCQEDRAVLCRDCDIPIHKANEYTKNHSRFLLTGVKLSPSSLYPISSSSNCCDTATTTTSKNTNKSRASVSNEIFSSYSMPSTPNKVDENINMSDNCSVSTSSISEYLMETLPGWSVEDFLDPSSAASNVMCRFAVHSISMYFSN